MEIQDLVRESKIINLLYLEICSNPDSHLMILENISAFSMGAWPCSWWSCDPAPPVPVPAPLVKLEEEGEEGDAPGLI